MTFETISSKNSKKPPFNLKKFYRVIYLFVYLYKRKMNSPYKVKKKRTSGLVGI